MLWIRNRWLQFGIWVATPKMEESKQQTKLQLAAEVGAGVEIVFLNNI